MYHRAFKNLLMDMLADTTTKTRSHRLKELRGNRTLRSLAEAMTAADPEHRVTPQAISNWEKNGHIARKHAEAYDDALGAGGEVLEMFGYAAAAGATLDVKLDVVQATIVEKLDHLLELVQKLVDRSKPRRGDGADSTPSSMPRPALRNRRSD